MVDIYINGDRLETERDLSLTFTKSNSLYDFDNVSTERSSSFSVPHTVTNARLLSFSDNVRMNGDAMRSRSRVTMLVNGVPSDGYLYVTSYTDSAYKCVVVCGENLSFLRLKEAGTIADLISGETDYVATYKAGAAYDQNNDTEVLIGNYNYKRSESGVVIPALNLWRLQEAALKKVSWVAVEALPDTITAKIPRYLPKELHDPQGELAVTLTTTKQIYEDSTTEITYVNQGTTTTVSGWLASVNVRMYRWDFRAYADADGNMQWYWYRVNPNAPTTYIGGWQAVSDLYLTFPDTDAMSSVYIVGEGVWAYNAETKINKGFAYLDDDATPVRGRTVSLPKGTKFVLINGEDYFEVSASKYAAGAVLADSNWQMGVNKLRADSDLNKSYLLVGQPSAAYGLAYGDATKQYAQTYIGDMDVTLYDLTKILAAVGGYSLYVNNDGKICYFDFRTWGGEIDLSGKITKWQEVARKFKDYKQHNLLQFTESEYVTAGMRNVVDYTVANDYLDEEQALLECPYSEGGRYDAAGQLFVKTEEGKTDKEIMFLYADSTQTLTQGAFAKNSGLASIVSRSTYVKAQALMTYWQYTRISPTTLLTIDGVKFTWTNIQWQSGVATMELQIKQ